MRSSNRSAERRYRDNLVCELWALGQRRGFLLPPHGYAAGEDRSYDLPVCRDFVRDLLALVDLIPNPNDYSLASDFQEAIRRVLDRCRSEAFREMAAEEMAEIARGAN